MLVGKRMSHPVITITPDVSLSDALAKMKREKVRRFPVVDKRGRLVGIVSENDLLHASPSDATSLSIWEVNYLLSKITVETVMTKEVITVTEDTPLEEAARIMADKKIGGLPVMKGNSVVGIITETNLFKIFLELLGARSAGVRATIVVQDVPGKLVELTNAILKLGGNIVSLSTFMGESSSTGTITIKVDNIEMKKLKEALEPLVVEIEDLREVKAV